MTLVNPKDLILNCRFADVEHTVIANALNAIGVLLIQKQDKETVFKKILPVGLDYLSKHLLHEERVMENAFEFWVEEQGWGDIYENLKLEFWNFLKRQGKNFQNYDFKDFVEFQNSVNNTDEEIKTIFKWWQLIENQKHGHKNIAKSLQEELSRINPESPPKLIASQLGMVVSYVLSRVLKLDKKYVNFYKETGIPACGEKPLLPPKEVVDVLKGILGKDFVDPFEFV